jgi:sugar phosphate permease
MASIASDSRPSTSVRWRRLLPIVFVTYSLAYLDRSNYSIGAAGGLERDLHITAATSALLGALFFLGYFLFQIPAAHYAERGSVKRLIFWCLLAWGVLASLQGVLPWVPALMVDRFLLGVVEAAILPAMLVFLMHWFTSRERGRANTVLILGNPITVLWLSALSGWLVSVTSWQWMFIIEGIPAIIWAFVFAALTADRPADAPWLPGPERDALAAALHEEQRHLPEVGGYLQALRSRTVLVLSVQYLLWSIGVYGFVFWLPTIVKAGAGVGIAATGLLSAVPYVLAVILMIVVSYGSDKTGRRRVYVWPFLLVAALAFYGSYLLGPGAFWPSFALLVLAGGCMYAPYGPYFALIPELVPQSVAGASMALVNSFGALGGFVGAYVVGWLNGSFGAGAAFVFMAIALLLAAGLMLAVPDSRVSQAGPSPAGAHARRAPR